MSDKDNEKELSANPEDLGLREPGAGDDGAGVPEGTVAESAAPDVVEMLPAPMPRVVRRLAQSLRAPLIAGGLITDKEDVLAALSAGALCVSTSDETLWSI